MRERARRILTWYVVSTATKPSGVSGTPALDLSHAVAGRPPEARKTTSAATLAGGAGAGAAPAAAEAAAESASSMGRGVRPQGSTHSTARPADTPHLSASNELPSPRCSGAGEGS